MACDLSPIGEPPIIDLPGQDGGKSWTDALQTSQLMPLALRGFARHRRQIAFTLDLDELLLHQGQSLDLSADLPAKTLWQGPAIAGDQVS